MSARTGDRLDVTIVHYITIENFIGMAPGYAYGYIIWYACMACMQFGQLTKHTTAPVFGGRLLFAQNKP